MKKYNLIYTNYLHIFVTFATFAAWETQRRECNIQISEFWRFEICYLSIQVRLEGLLLSAVINNDEL